MNVVKGIFWVVAVSFLFAGGNGLAANYGDRPGAEYLGTESPAYASSRRVMENVSTLKGVCQTNEKPCALVAKAGGFVLSLVNAGMEAIFGPDDSKSEKPYVPKGLFGLEGQEDFEDTSPFFDGDALSYEDDEELEDIG